MYKGGGGGSRCKHLAPTSKKKDEIITRGETVLGNPLPVSPSLNGQKGPFNFLLSVFEFRAGLFFFFGGVEICVILRTGGYGTRNEI